jgi:GINS complex subunit 2
MASMGRAGTSGGGAGNAAVATATTTAPLTAAAAADATSPALPPAPQSGIELLRRGLNASGRALAEFSAGDSPVRVVPQFSSAQDDEVIVLLVGRLGPFDAVTPSVVPLWAALELRARGYAAIRPPPWLAAESLQEALQEERASELLGGSLPDDAMEVAALLLDQAHEDVPDADRVRQLLDEIWTVRSNKLAAGLRLLSAESSGIKLENISNGELEGVREIMLGAMDHFASIRVSDDALDGRFSQSQLG